MPIVMRLYKGQNCPVIICDECQRRIEDAKDGNVEFKMLTGDGRDRNVVFLHKGDCTLAYEATHDGRVCWGSDELAGFVLLLGHNIRISKSDAAQFWTRFNECGF